MLSRRNDGLVSNLRSEYVNLYAPTTTLGNIVSLNLGIPLVRAYWSFTSVDESSLVYDLSGQGRTLSPSGTPTFAFSGVKSYANLVRASSQYFYRADEAGLEFTKLTVCGWFKFDTESTGNITGLVSKYTSLGDLCSWRLFKSAADAITFSVNSTGHNHDNITVSDTGENYNITSWFFIAGCYANQQNLKLFVNGKWYTNSVGVPASLFNSTANLAIGRTDGGNYLDGQVCHVLLSGEYL
jgi:hypothetical protein